MTIQKILNSPIQKIVSDSISLVQYNQLPMLVIKHDHCLAAISLQGAQLLYWHPTHSPSTVIWLSDKSAFEAGVAIRGGVPICWPHFANFGEPLHGFARLLEWSLKSYSEDQQGVALCFELTNSVESHQYLEQPFCLTVTMQLGLTCAMELSMEADDLTLTTALHSYFNISDIENIKVSGLGDSYQERLITVNPPLTSGEVTFDQAVDRIYTQPEPVSIVQDKDRCIKITHFNATDVVVWNPGAEKCKTMPDMDDNAYKTMVCVETGRIMQPAHCLGIEKIGFKIELI